MLHASLQNRKDFRVSKHHNLWSFVEWLASYPVSVPFSFFTFLFFYFQRNFALAAPFCRTVLGCKAVKTVVVVLCVLNSVSLCAYFLYFLSSSPFLTIRHSHSPLIASPVMAYVHGRDKNVLHACICIIVWVINGNDEDEDEEDVPLKV